MNEEQKDNMMALARQIAEELYRKQGIPMLPATAPALQACGTNMPTSGCEGLLYAPITTFRFYRAGRTELAAGTRGVDR
jgi:hypothetical protein